MALQQEIINENGTTTLYHRIAKAELAPTLKNNMIWVIIHYLLSVLFIIGLIPVFGLA